LRSAWKMQASSTTGLRQRRRIFLEEMESQANKANCPICPHLWRRLKIPGRTPGT
ncbi:unnamed protein product, partial [marine sediment metagenome]